MNMQKDRMMENINLAKPKSSLWRSIAGVLVFASLALLAAKAENMILCYVLAAASLAECILTADYFRSRAAVTAEGFEITSLAGRKKRIPYAETGSVSCTKDSLFIRSKEGKILATLDFDPAAGEQVLKMLENRDIPVYRKERKHSAS